MLANFSRGSLDSKTESNFNILVTGLSPVEWYLLQGTNIGEHVTEKARCLFKLCNQGIDIHIFRASTPNQKSFQIFIEHSRRIDINLISPIYQDQGQSFQMLKSRYVIKNFSVFQFFNNNLPTGNTLMKKSKNSKIVP